MLGPHLQEQPPALGGWKAPGEREQGGLGTHQGFGSLSWGERGVKKAPQKGEAEIRTNRGLRRKAEKHLECGKEELPLVSIADSRLDLEA